MNQINPEKLLLSKWTVIEPTQKQRHFMVTKIIRDDDATIITCELEAIMTHDYLYTQLNGRN